MSSHKIVRLRSVHVAVQEKLENAAYQGSEASRKNGTCHENRALPTSVAFHRVVPVNEIAVLHEKLKCRDHT